MIEMIIAGDELKNALAKIKSVKEGTYVFSNEELDYLNKFQAIDMSNQEWDDFSDIEYFKNLVTIYLQESIIHSFNGIKKIKSLKRLNLRHSVIKDTASIEELENIEELSLDFAKISDCSNVCKLENLVTLSLSGLDIKNLNKIRELKKLKLLDLSFTNIVDLSEISSMENLRSLHLTGTQIDSIKDIVEIEKLEYLDISNTKIHDVSNIDKLINLQTLYLDKTKVKDLTPLSRLKSLKELSLGAMNVNSLDGVEKLKNLVRLDLDRMNLRSVPKGIALLPKIYELEKPYFVDLEEWNEIGMILYGSTLSTQPISLFEQPKELVKAYYEAPRVPINESKVVFLGNGGAGKTYTIERIMNNGERGNYQTDTTPGIKITQYHAIDENTRFDINFWDFGGQEIMHSMHRCFLTGRTCYVIVIYNRNESLDRQARYWLKNIESFAKGCPVILAVNCFEDSFTEGVDSQKLRADFPNLGDVITYSAKCSDDKEFQRLIDAIIKQAKRMDSSGMEFPENWANIRAGLLQLAAEGYPYIDNKKYYELCDKYGENNPAIRKWLLEWFNDLGICFSYHQENDGKELEEYKVLSPKWLTNAIYIIINSGKGRSKHGVILKQTIIDILNMGSTGVEKDVCYSEEEVDYVLAVMRKFRLSYKLPNPEGESEEEFIPALCSYIEPENVYLEEGEYEKHLIYQMRYSYLPDNVIHQLMIECYNNLNANKIWRQGMRIDDKVREQSAIVSIREDKILQIDIYSTQEHPIWTLLQHLRRKIIGINNRLNIIANDYIIKQKNNQTAAFPVESVLKAKQKGRTEMDCSDGGEFETYYISDILEDSFGNENIELYMERVNDKNEDISVDRLSDIVRHTHIYYKCFFDNSMGFSEEHVIKFVQEMLKHEESITANVIDTFMDVLNTHEDPVVSDITQKVKQSKMNKLDCLQKLTSVGANAIKIKEALNMTWATIQTDFPDIWGIMQSVMNNS